MLLVVALRRQDVANDQLQRFKREWRPRVNKKYYGLRGVTTRRKTFMRPLTAPRQALFIKTWNLDVTKNVFFDNRIYMFTLRCWDGPKRPD